MKNLTISALLFLFCSTSFSQESFNLGHQANEIELGIGINTFGPARSMDQLMQDYGFDETTTSWFTGDDIKHPHYSAAGLSAQIAYFHSNNEKHSFGAQVYFNHMREVFGSSEVVGLLFVNFFNLSLAPVYQYQISKGIELQAGPALAINIAYRSSDEHIGDEKYVKIAPGILAGMNVSLWDKKTSYGKIRTQYQLCTKSKMGPFSAESFGVSFFILESKFNYSHLNIMFVTGIHF